MTRTISINKIQCGDAICRTVFSLIFDMKYNRCYIILYGDDKMKRSLTEKQKKICSLIAFIIFIVFMVGVTVFIGIPMVKLAKTPEIFREWVNGFGIWGRIIFVGMIVLQVIVALIPG